MSQNTILLIDIETTGLEPKSGKIVEVGIVTLNLETGEINTIMDVVCHETGITKQEVEESWIVKNGYITLEEVRHSQNFSNLKPVIQKIIDCYPTGATAFNREFDFRFLKDRGITFQKELPCPMLLSTDICKLPGKYENKHKWPKAQEAYDHFFPESEYKEKHRGADDAFHEAQIVHELYKIGVFKIN